ncbi:hypothetical protein D3C71_2026700 [compost metagenome]
MGGRQCFGNRETVAPVGNGVLGVTAVQVTTGELSLIAEVLPARRAKRALAAGPAEPRNTYSQSDPAGRNISPHSRHFADDFMPRHPRQYRLR